jgi:threonine-phosphate decarboxylase
MSGLVPMHGGQLRQISERFHIPASQLMDFSANINPDGPPSAVLSTLRTSLEDTSMLTAYPDLEQTGLRQSIALYAGVRPKNIAVANGFIPLLQSALPALKVRRCLVPVPAFIEYRRSLTQAGVEIEPHGLTAETNFEYDVFHLARALAEGGHEAILLANPQNPSGVLTPKDILLQFVSNCARRSVTVLLDEAFIDYAPLDSLATDTERFTNLIVFRSVTKFHGIPGLRVAYVVANEIIARALSAFLPPWPITTLASCAATSALADHAFATRSRLQNVQRRARLKAALDAVCIRTYPAAANFLLFRLPESVSAEQFWRRMIVKHHIVLRDCSNYEALPPGHFRAAVHTEKKNEQLVRAVAASLA